jgi:hypothetical protein
MKNNHAIERRANIAKDHVWTKCRATAVGLYEKNFNNARIVEAYMRDSYMSAIASLDKSSDRFKLYLVEKSQSIKFPKGSSVHAAALVFADSLSIMTADEVRMALINIENSKRSAA